MPRAAGQPSARYPGQVNRCRCASQTATNHACKPAHAPWDAHLSLALRGRVARSFTRSPLYSYVIVAVGFTAAMTVLWGGDRGPLLLGRSLTVR